MVERHNGGASLQKNINVRTSIRKKVVGPLVVALVIGAVAVHWWLRFVHERGRGVYCEVCEDGTRLYTSRCDLTDLRPFLPDPNKDFAEITLRAERSEKETEVVLSPAALATLREVFGEDFEYQRHNVWAAVQVVVKTANVNGEMPHVGAASFKVEVTHVRVSRNAGRELSGALLTAAGYRAMGAFLEDWQKEQQMQ